MSRHDTSPAFSLLYLSDVCTSLEHGWCPLRTAQRFAGLLASIHRFSMPQVAAVKELRLRARGCLAVHLVARHLLRGLAS